MYAESQSSPVKTFVVRMDAIIPIDETLKPIGL